MSEVATNRAGEPIVLTERQGHIGIVRMNRPESRNAMSADLLAALIRTWEEHESDDQIWGHIITGVGDRAFCAGADLVAVNAGNALTAGSPEERTARLELHRIRSVPLGFED